MKKFFVFFFMVFMALFVVSCNSDEQYNEVGKVSSQEKLLRELKDSINALNSRAFGYSKTRGKGVYTKKEKFFIILADAIGAAYEKNRGGDEIQVILTSAEFSIMAKDYVDSRQPVLSGVKELNGGFIKPSPFTDVVFSIGNEIDSLGLYHNKLVYSAELNHFSSQNVDTLTTRLCNVYALEKGLQLSFVNHIITDNSFMNSLKAYRDIIFNDTDYSMLAASARNDIGNGVDIITPIEDYITTILEADELETDIYGYTDQVLNYINKVKVVDDDKIWNILQTGIVVGYASYRLWNLD